MNHRSILHRVALIVVFTAVVSLFSAFSHDEAVSAATTIQQSGTSGALRVVDEAGKPVAECPLKHTAVKAEVSGFMARVTVTQNFENPFPNKIEAVYTFPLPEMAAVDDLTMRIDDRTIKGKIMRRDEASAAYTTAKQMGQVASLLDQERPNIFTQQVANILPGQQIRVSISYVETLKYEDGSYEWSFPMIVAPRYNATPGDSDSARLSPPRLPAGMRAGHDLSLEIDLDAGVPIVNVNSTSHEIDVQQTDEKRAVVRLKDHTTIPNKDFLLTYGVAGDSIKDAVLAHRSERGGFFTLILQPPQRVQAEDVMPKEMVFVLDTSGSMQGAPLETAKETVQLALDTLYPHDTFNLIIFSGDTRILFPELVSATPENLRQAKNFLSSLNGVGGTEMMKAIKAALDPSDSQYHLRLACFLTDGQVGNEAEILAEVQKHKNARVFAMGFGDAPNRSLLNKMTHYGRGEVDYVIQTTNSPTVARRFNDRIRNPLLTDISVEWSNLTITEVFPRRIPDLFGARPLILSGRYKSGGKGTIVLKGKMAGQDFVREIPIELPEVEENHDALSTLWARNKIDDLMAAEVAYTGDQNELDQKREEITQLGLTFKLMTKYTSLVAVDDALFTGSEEPVRVEVPVEAAAALIVSSASYSLQMSAGTARNVTVHTVQALPLQGRSVVGLFTLTPGTGFQSSPAAFSTRGQSNTFTVDGVAANFGIAPGGESPGTSASGNAPAVTASGGANGIVSVDASEEVVVQTAPAQAELDVAGGPQLAVTTRSGTNSFHGSVFHFFGNGSLDANDWFANARGLKKPPKRLNLSGATLGGPINRDRTFFFLSYEGLRLRQPVTGLTDVPSLSTREAAPGFIRPFLEGFPVPTGALRPDGFAEFAATFANPARHDAGSIRLDHNASSTSNLRGRYSFADSGATRRGADGFSLSTTNRIRTRAQSFTGSFSQTLSPTMVLELDANYSRSRVSGSYLMDQFGGARNTFPEFPQAGSFAFDLNSRNAGLIIGDAASNTQRQINLRGDATWISGNHTVRFGGDYRRLSPIVTMRIFEDDTFFDGLSQVITGAAARINHLVHSGPQHPVFHNLSLYGQEEWKQSSRITLIFGLRWEPAPARSLDQGFAVDQVNDPATLKFAAPGTSLWKTTFGNFAPRAAFAYQLLDRHDHELVLRGGVNISYDRGQDRSGDIFANSIPFISGSSIINPPFTIGNNLPFRAFDPNLKLPYTINWSLSARKAVGSSQAASVAYLASSGKRLPHTATLFDRNPDFRFLRVTANRAGSNHRSLEFTYERLMLNGFGAVVSYAWSHSTDNVFHDSDRRILMTSLNPQLDFGPSDFDIRHQLSGSISYALPAPFASGLGNTVLRNWYVDTIFSARSSKPLDILYVFPTSIGVAYFRPDRVDGTLLYVSDPAAPGGRRINEAALVVPATLRQGSLGRNSLRGFPFHQIDLGLRRKFNFTDSFALQVQADAFNLLNQANFEDPLGTDLVVGSPFRPNSAFGQSTSLNGRSLSSGGFSSFYGRGGARALQLSLKLTF